MLGAEREKASRSRVTPQDPSSFFTWFTSENSPREGLRRRTFIWVLLFEGLFALLFIFYARVLSRGIIGQAGGSRPAALVLRPCGCAHHSGRPLLRLLAAPPVSRSRVSSVPPRLAAPMEHRAAAWSRFERRTHGFDRKFFGFPAHFTSFITAYFLNSFSGFKYKIKQHSEVENSCFDSPRIKIINSYSQI